ncbi:hypothetical protein PTKIN_Ptkin19aG0135700 [Pterospermum kingtungense]
MKQYDDLSDLLNHSGFTWDEAKQMIAANDDVWELHIKIFEDKVLDGNGIAGGQVLQVKTDRSAPEVIPDRACDNLQTPGEDINLSDQQGKWTTSTPDIGRASKAQKTDQEMLSEMAGVVTRLQCQKATKYY